MLMSELDWFELERGVVDVQGLLESMIVQRQYARVGAEDAVRASDASERADSIDLVNMVAIVEGFRTSRCSGGFAVFEIAKVPGRVDVC